MSADGAPARRIHFAEWFNFVQRRLGRLEAGMAALETTLTPGQGRQLNQAMERWDHEHPQFATAREPQAGDVVTFGDGETSP